MARPHIKGVMAYATLRQLFTGISGGSRDTVGTAQFNWNVLDGELDKIINQAGKKAMVNISAGYCPDGAWPPPIQVMHGPSPYMIVLHTARHP